MAKEAKPRGTAGEHLRWNAFCESFIHSNYITDFWNWFLTLLSKSAELVLFGSILYSSYQLIPGVPQVPATVDAFLFLLQQGALDVGGLGLLKLAKRAGLTKDSFPMRVGVALVVLMILNVVLATVKRALPMVPGWIYVTVETLLLIARAVMAVLFGHAIHALREEYSESTITIKEARELQQHIETMTNELANVRQFVHQQFGESEHRITEYVRSHITEHQHRIQQNTEHLRANIEQRITESEQQVSQIKEAHAQERLEALTEQMQVYAQTLAATQEQLHVLASEVKRTPSMSEAVQRAAAPKRTERTANEQGDIPANIRQFGKAKETPKRTERTTAPNTTANLFDKGQFVRQCLTDDPTLRNSDIQRQAADLGQAISASYISETRKAFFGEQTEQATVAG